MGVIERRMSDGVVRNSGEFRGPDSQDVRARGLPI
jgi:hypothetical protein